ncbi:MAG: ATP-dependent DNA helicase RecG, partial [Christensenellaceae bacterium]|nr:ATP-dependent DNA helicase RecG [Christensenellaceae bacterium]
IPKGALEDYYALLPFTCTGAQKRVLGEIWQDLAKNSPMNRLVEGDVGCGKTAVAMGAAYGVARAGGQTVIMAPTELLATQHYEFAKTVFGSRAALLKGATTAKERQLLKERIAAGDIDLVVGTHALLYTDLPFSNLSLVVTDEQHRFGVGQRAALLRGSAAAHMLIMSATPIPRTLALVLYGKAEISVIDQRPPGRKPVKTHIVGQKKRKDLYNWLRERLAEGEKAYVVCPLVEKNEELEALSVEEAAAGLKKFMKGYAVGVLHGRMSPEEKQTVMEGFRSGDIRLLVSTTVIEVGMDVPDATVMVVESADRFGLAQLHQLRGRVGRGQAQAYCYLVSDGSGTERLKILKSSDDGFIIAEKDLQLRGSGQLTGQRQHGKEGLICADLVRDVEVLREMGQLQEDLSEKLPEESLVLTRSAINKMQAGQAEVVLN